MHQASQLMLPQQVCFLALPPPSHLASRFQPASQHGAGGEHRCVAEQAERCLLLPPIILGDHKRCLESGQNAEGTIGTEREREHLVNEANEHNLANRFAVQVGCAS